MTNILESLFGSPVPDGVNLVLLVVLLVAVLLLVGWVFRKFLGRPSIKAVRGRQPRLAVTDAANLDDKRRLVLVRRDDVEHLVMIGGATDVLLESNIVRATLKRQPTSQSEPEIADENSGNIAAIAATGAGAAVALSTVVDASEEPVLAVDENAGQGVEGVSDKAGDASISDFISTPSSQTPLTAEIDTQTGTLPQADTPNIETDIKTDGVMVDLEEALGGELGDELSDELSGAVSAIDETPLDAEPKAAGAEPDKMEDEMQKLLDELSGEKV